MAFIILVVGETGLYAGHRDSTYEKEMEQLYLNTDKMLYRNLDSAQHLASIFYEKSLAAKDTFWLEEALSSLGWVFYTKGEMDTAKTLFKQSELLYTKRNDKVGLFWVYFGLGSVASSEANYSGSITYYLKAEALFNHVDIDPMDATFLHYGISLAFYEYGDLESAQDFFDKANQLALKNNFKDSLPFLYNMQAELALVTGHLDSADQLITRSLKLQAKSKDVEDLFYAYDIMSRIALKRGKPEEAMRYTEKARQIGHGYGDDELEIVAAIRMGSIYLALDRPRQALKQLQYAYDLSADLPPNYERRLCLKVYSNVLAANGEPQKALNILRNLTVINDSISSSSLRALILQRDYESSLAQNDILELKTRVQDEKIQEEKHTLIGSVIVIALLICMLVLFIFNILKTRRTNKLLAEKNTLIDSKSQELEEKNTQLSQNNRDKDRLLSILTHDLRQPFNQAESLLNLLKDYDLQNESLNDLVVTISESLARDKRSVDNLLAWSKSQLVGIKANPQNVRIKKVFKAIREELHQSIDSKKLQLEVDVSDISAYVDNYHLEIILKNLLVNAIKFSEPHNHISFSARQNGKMVEISVRDEGVGMSKTQIDRLLNSEFYFSSRGTLNEAGSGLGMLIVNDFVKKNNGTIEIVSALGEGTLFRISLPLGSAKTNPVAETP